MRFISDGIATLSGSYLPQSAGVYVFGAVLSKTTGSSPVEIANTFVYKVYRIVEDYNDEYIFDVDVEFSKIGSLNRNDTLTVYFGDRDTSSIGYSVIDSSNGSVNTLPSNIINLNTSSNVK